MDKSLRKKDYKLDKINELDKTKTLKLRYLQ
jgi:hypothetical protein